jgi:hypothetical protein
MGEMVRAAALVIGLTASLMAAGTAFAAHPLITDDTGTQGRGKFQLEATGTWITDQEDTGGEGVREIGSLAVLAFAAGVSETLDLVVGVPYMWTETKEAGQTTRDDGPSDTVIEAKWRFYDKEKFSMAIKPGLLFPTGDEEQGRGTGHVGYATFLISTFETEPWAFDANIGYLYLENRLEERVQLWFASLATRFAVSEQWTVVGEIGATRNADPDDKSHPAFTQAGLIFSPSDDLDLSLGFLAGLSDAEVDQAVRVGVTIRF